MTVSAKLDALRGCAAHALECAEAYIPYALTIRTRRWSGGRRDTGIKHDSDLVLPPRHQMRQVSAREILASGGRYQNGDYLVQDIPKAFASHGGGGYTIAQLDPKSTFLPTDSGLEVIYILTGDLSGYFTLVNVDDTDPVFFRLVIRRTRDFARLGDTL